jgi:hypothetical protein
MQQSSVIYDGTPILIEKGSCLVVKDAVCFSTKSITSGHPQESGNVWKQMDNNNNRPQKRRPSAKRNAHWEKMLSELIEYREKYGDTLVPAEFSDNPQLGTWGKYIVQDVIYYIYIYRIYCSCIDL